MTTMRKKNNGTIDQEETIAFLSDPATHNGLPVEHIETHISHIFMAGPKAYKLKKPVRLPFLDFSSVTKRKHACHRELIINRRYAPEIYLHVDRIAKTRNQLRFDGSGRTVDYVVTMTRFEGGHLLSQLCERGDVEDRWIIDFADRLADIHAHAKDLKSLEHPEHLVKTAIDTLSNLSNTIHDEHGRDQVLASSLDLVEQFNKLAAFFDERQENGFVRHCHADLHTENVCLVDDRLLPFDAIEFSDRMATIDVAYDTGFLVMDLIAHQQQKLACIFLSRYLSATRDFGLLRIIEPCVGLRAAVRALVLGLKTEATGKPAPMRQTYLDLFAANSAHKVKPTLIAIGGRSGSGKSTIAPSYALDCAAPWGAVILNTDVIRKRLAGLKPEQHLEPTAYSAASSEEIYEHLFEDAATCLENGHPVVLDATFLSPAQRQRAEMLAQEKNVPFRGIWLEASRTQLRNRVANRKRSASDAGLDVLNKQLELDVGEIDWEIVETKR